MGITASNMNDEIIWGAIGAIFGGAVSQIIPGLFNRKKTKAEEETLRVKLNVEINKQALDLIATMRDDIDRMREDYEEKIKHLTEQNKNAQNAISSLRKNERDRISENEDLKKQIEQLSTKVCNVEEHQKK